MRDSNPALIIPDKILFVKRARRKTLENFQKSFQSNNVAGGQRFRRSGGGGGGYKGASSSGSSIGRPFK